ncbi:MAG: hypothetical protein EXR71_02455 [Myxococcales bacterium]|nr:hypothetical protein [Myxococcales bacterium]
MIVLFGLVAFAAEPSVEAPEVARFDVPATGVSRIRLPPAVAGVAPSLLGSTLSLRNGAGDVVPFAVLTTDRVSFDTERLDVVQFDDHHWRVGPSVRLVQSLRFPDVGGWHPGRLSLDGIGSFIFPTGTINGQELTAETVPVPPGRGPWVVRSDSHLAEVIGESFPNEYVEADCATLEAEAPALTESGYARYALDLGGPRQVRSLRVLSDADVFDRNVQLFVPGDGREYYGETRPIRRLTFGGATYDATRIEDLAFATDALLVDVQTAAGQTLPITGFEVCSVGAELVVRDPGAGPFTAYFGVSVGNGSQDLTFGGPDLVRLATTRVTEVTVEANPVYVPLETREGLDGPGAILPMVKWKWERPIVGSGWLRIPLDRDVLARAQTDLSDLRIVDGDDRQIPLVVRRTGRETLWETAGFTREEQGRSSLIRIPLGQSDAPVATLTLTTSRDVFSRRITVLRDRGTMTEPLRVVDWRGDGAGTSVAVAVDAIVGRELLVRIDNGDNAPLPVDSVTVSFPEWELRANVPEGARLVYGSRVAGQAEYDLGLLSQDLVVRKLAVGALGEAKAIGGPALVAGERFVVLAVVGALALGLLVMVGRLLATARQPLEA